MIGAAETVPVRLGELEVYALGILVLLMNIQEFIESVFLKIGVIVTGLHLEGGVDRIDGNKLSETLSEMPSKRQLD
jgi:hypothetical protein